jgi:site-specific DNA-methyltransferase (adenine-specific)
MVSRKETIAEGVTLYLGDCREVLPMLGQFGAVVTDPPYGIKDKAFDSGRRSGKRTGGDNTWHDESWWDAAIDPEWPRLASAAAPLVAWFGHWRKRGEVEAAMGLPLRAEIIWAKDCHVGPPCPVAMRDERIWLFAKDGIKGRVFDTSVWDVPIIPTWSRKHHKNEKPIALMRRLVDFIDAGTILDPFMGSGTTGVAAVQLGRRFSGIEVEQSHFDVACKRIAEATKQTDLFIERPAPAEQIEWTEMWSKPHERA